jgi:ATP-dependent DNA ligase
VSIYARRRTLSGEPNSKHSTLNGVFWQTPETLDVGEALFEAVCAHELEGVVAKRRGSPYQLGTRAWVKTKNRDYWPSEMEH